VDAHSRRADALLHALLREIASNGGELEATNGSLNSPADMRTKVRRITHGRLRETLKSGLRAFYLKLAFLLVIIVC
jgi:hypothetical protein